MHDARVLRLAAIAIAARQQVGLGCSSVRRERAGEREERGAGGRCGLVGGRACGGIAEEVVEDDPQPPLLREDSTGGAEQPEKGSPGW